MMESPIDGTPQDLDHALELHALHMAASIALLRTMIDGAEATIPTLPRLGQTRRRAALGRLRHVLGIEVRPNFSQTVALAQTAAVLDIGQSGAGVGWLLLILDGPRTHAAEVTRADVEHLRVVARDEDFAIGELRLWIENTHEIDTARRAAGLDSEVVAVALREVLRHG